MRPQNVILFSSGKNLKVAEALAEGMRGTDCRPVVWKDYFRAVYGEEYERTKSYALFPFLSKKIPSFDFAVVVAGDDDATRKDVPAGHWADFSGEGKDSNANSGCCLRNFSAVSRFSSRKTEQVP